MNLRNTILLLTFSALFLLAGCSGDEPGTAAGETPLPDLTGMSLQQQVAVLIEADRYEQALEILRDADPDDPMVQQLKRDTHLIFGLWLTYSADSVQMSERMGGALRHYRRVLELDPENSRARAEINQIEGIYTRMGRPIPEGVAD
jgi:hypothetical protein